ncbi:MAG: hypothetical protein JSR66_29375 [Proteobacteria bacterium]|nr:hypothetical protein [Pseudomonadota bacterium]
MPTIVKPMLAAGLLLALSACSKLGGGGQDQMAWAKDALDRNDRVEVVASDPQAKTFTVRVKESGQLVVLPVDQIIAGPAGTLALPDKQAAVSPASNQSAAPAPPPPAPETSVPEAAPLPVAPGRTDKPLPGPSQPSSSPSLATSGEAARPASDENAAPDETAQPMDSAKGPHAESASRAKAGAVLAEGPGYSIKASGSKSVASTASPAGAPRGAPERLHDPIICQGSRLLHIDNRNLEFDGDAITAEDGCEIHITNTHISAKGIGVLARAANVHIKNSEIDGDSGAVDASEGAQVYAQSSRFKGLTRRLESSSFHDLGGNVWN